MPRKRQPLGVIKRGLTGEQRKEAMQAALDAFAGKRTYKPGDTITIPFMPGRTITIPADAVGRFVNFRYPT